MTIQYCSDLHLEFLENENFLRRNPLKAAGEVLLLAGDIVPFAIQKKQDWFFDLISDQFEMVWCTPKIGQVC